MNEISRVARLGTLVIVSILAIGIPAHSAQAQERNTTLEEITVTAQKREQSLQDVPLSVSVLSGAALDDGGNLVDIQSIQAQVPSLTYRRGSGNRESSLIVRGIGTVSFSTAAEPAVATVIDGVVLSRSGAAFNELADIERIEVLKGPQGTLFGKNASAGVINVVTKGPTEEFEASAQASYFERSEVRFKTSISGPVSDSVGVRLNGFFGTFDGILDNIYSGERTQGYDRSGLRGVVEWEASEALTIKFAGDFMSRDDNCCADVLSGPPSNELNALLQGGTGMGVETRELNQDQPATNFGDASGLQVNLDYEFEGGHTLTSITAARNWDDTLLFDLDFGPNSVPSGPLFEDSAGGFFGANGIVDEGITEVDQFTQEFRIASPGGGRLEYVAGLYFFTSELDRTFTRTVSTCTDSPLPVDPVVGLAPCSASAGSTISTNSGTAVMNVQIDNIALFGNAEYFLNDDLALIFGARYTDDEIQYTHNRVNDFPGGSGPGVGAAFTSANSISETDFSVKLGARYSFSDDISGYATYTQGYKGPAFDVFFNMNPLREAPVGAETSDSYELGLKTTLADGRVTANFAAWLSEFQNFQANSFVEINGVLTTSLTNAGDVETSGFEADVKWQATENFSLSGSIASTDAKVTGVNIPEGASQGQIDSLNARIGTPLQFSPDLAYNLAAKYWIPLDAPFDLFFDTQYTWQDDVASDSFIQDLDSSVFKIDSYGIWNANFGLESDNGNYALILHVRNISDESYVSTVSGGFDGGARLQIPRDADRYWGLTARFAFN